MLNQSAFAARIVLKLKNYRQTTPQKLKSSCGKQKRAYAARAFTSRRRSLK